MLLVLATLAFATLTPLEPLEGVSTQTKSFEPSTNVKALFASPNREPGAVGPDTKADMTIITKFPTINLANFEPIKAVHCNGTDIDITFADQESAKAAWTEWSKEPKLGMIAAPQHGCGGDNLVFLDVKELKLEENIIKGTQTEIPSDDIVEEFQLDLLQDKPLGQSSRSRLRKRDKEFTLKEYSFALNHDGQSVKERKKVLRQVKDLSVVCEDCSLRGNVRFTVSASKGKPGLLPTAKVAVDGKLIADFGLRINGKPGTNADAGAVDMFQLSLLPFKIGNLVQIGPKIALSAGVKFDQGDGKNTESDLSTRAVIEYPFSFSGQTPDKLFCGPSFQNTFFTTTPNTDVKSVDLDKGDGTVAATASIGPRLGFGIQVYKLKFEVGLAFDSKLSVQAKRDACPGVKLDTIIQQDYAFTANYKVCDHIFKQNLYTKQSPINCPFCNMCVDGKRRTPTATPNQPQPQAQQTAEQNQQNAQQPGQQGKFWNRFQRFWPGAGRA